MAAISAFVGMNGSGKSLACVENVVMPGVEAGHVVVANCRLDVPDFRLLRSWRELIRIGVHVCELTGEPMRLGPRGERLEPADPRFRDELPIFSLTLNRPTVLMLDEITSCLPSRASASMPPQLQRILNQLRKAEVTLGWTAPAWKRCDLLLREVTQEVTECRGLLPDRYRRVEGRRFFPKAARDDEGAKVALSGNWRPNRLFRWSTYDAVDFEEFTLDTTVKLRPSARRTYWRSCHVAQSLYRTKESVQLLDHLDDLGTCVNCAGRRSQPKCSCDAGPEASTQEGPGRPERRSRLAGGPPRRAALVAVTRSNP